MLNFTHHTRVFLCTDQKKPSRRRGKRRKVVFPETLPRKEIVHRLREEDIPEELRDNPAVRRILKQIRDYVETVEPSVFVVVEYLEQLALDNADATKTTIVSAARPKRLVSCSVGDRLLAELAVERFADYMPYYRLEERLARLQIRFPRKTIAGWMIRLAEGLGPLLRRMHSIVLGSSVLCVDETPRAIKLPVIGRKNSLFFGSVAGGRAAMGLYSLMATCRRHCIDPSAYLHDVITRLPTASDEDIEALLPDRWAQSHPQHRITIRAEERTRRATTKRIRRAARRNLATPSSR